MHVFCVFACLLLSISFASVGRCVRVEYQRGRAGGRNSGGDDAVSEAGSEAVTAGAGGSSTNSRRSNRGKQQIERGGHRNDRDWDRRARQPLRSVVRIIWTS